MFKRAEERGNKKQEKEVRKADGEEKIDTVSMVTYDWMSFFIF